MISGTIPQLRRIDGVWCECSKDGEKPQEIRIHVTGLDGKELLPDLETEKKVCCDVTFRNICKERCNAYHCRKELFTDGNERLVVYDNCPFYLEAFLHDCRNNQ